MEVKSSDFSDVFVSYRRTDVEFTKKLVEALQADGKQVWIDWEDIPPGSVGFSDDIKRGLEGADAFIAVLTPDYLASPYCMELELKYAVELKKKLIPVVLKKFDGQVIPADISHINWIYFTPHAGHENSFEESLPKVKQALDTDLVHVRTHKQFLLRALEWNNNDRKPSYLLRGNVLNEAESWLAAATDKVPNPTELHAQFTLESRKAATAQQRRLIAFASVAAVVMAILTVFAAFQWREAERNKRIAEANERLAVRNAEESRSLALAANSQLNLNNNNLELAVALAAEGSQMVDPPQDTVLVLDETSHLPGTRMVLAGHTAAINAVAMHPDNVRVLSASDDQSLILWDITSGEQLATLTGHEAAVNSVVWSVASEQAFSCDASGVVIMWDIATAAEANRFTSEHGACYDLLAMPDGDNVLAAYDDGALILWSIESGEIVRENSDHLKAVRSLALSADGTRYASAENSGQSNPSAAVIIWDAATGEEVTRLEIGGNVTDIEFSYDGEDIFVSQDASGRGVIKQWNIASGAAVQSLLGHVARTDVIRVFENGALAISGAPDNTAILWQLTSSAELSPTWQYIGHQSAIYDVAVTSDGNTLVTASADNTLRIWDVYNSAVAATGLGHVGYVVNTAFNDDATIAYSVGADKVVRAWDTATGDEIVVENNAPLNETISGLDYNAATDSLLVAVDNGEILLLDATSRQVKHDMSGVHEDWVRSVAISPDGQIGVAADRSGIIAFYNLNDGTVIEQLTIGALHSSVAFNHSGNIVAIGSFGDNRIVLLDSSTREEIAAWAAPASIWNIDFSPDDALIVLALGNGQLALYDVATMELIRTFVGHSDDSGDVAFINDGQWLMSVSDDKTVRVWNVADGTQVRRVTLFAPIYSLDTTSDGRLAVVGLDNGMVQMLNIPPYTPTELLEWVSNNRYPVAFSCDERRVYHLSIENTDCAG